MPAFKRKVFYLSGFDPRGFRFYYNLYKEHAAKYSALSGETLSVSERKRLGPHETGWEVQNETKDTRTDYSFLNWEDIVQKAWIRNPLALYWRGVKAYVSYFCTLHWPQIFRLPYPPIITFAYPLLSLFLVPFVLFSLSYEFLRLLLGSGGMFALLNPLAAAIAAFVLSAMLLRYIKTLWLVRFFIFNHELSAHGNYALQERLDEFKEIIADALDAGGYDEILLITHSNGSILSVPLMELLLQRCNGSLPANFHLLTLGQCIPLFTMRRDAVLFRQQLEMLSHHEFNWMDIGYPADGVCYALTNPFLPYFPDYKPKLKMLSARLFKFFDAETYPALRRNKFLLHFQYLTCGDKISPLNYFKITAGPQHLPALAAEMENL